MIDVFTVSPFWWWTAAALGLLAVEVATGAELFLWPAASAGVVAVLTAVGVPLPVGFDVGLFAVLTIATTLAARKVRRPPLGPDINDPLNRLIGVKGTAVAAFERGRGRVLVEGTEWAAELQHEADHLSPGDRVEVAAILDGGRLKVRRT